jgi:hypothetical protein
VPDEQEQPELGHFDQGERVHPALRHPAVVVGGRVEALKLGAYYFFLIN